MKRGCGPVCRRTCHRVRVAVWGLPPGPFVPGAGLELQLHLPARLLRSSQLGSTADGFCPRPASPGRPGSCVPVWLCVPGARAGLPRDPGAAANHHGRGAPGAARTRRMAWAARQRVPTSIARKLRCLPPARRRTPTTAPTRSSSSSCTSGEGGGPAGPRLAGVRRSGRRRAPSGVRQRGRVLMIRGALCPALDHACGLRRSPPQSVCQAMRPRSALSLPSFTTAQALG